MNDLAVIVLAAGKSKRMKTRIPKVLHKVGDKAIIDRVISAVSALNPASMHVVVGYLKGSIMEHLGKSVIYAEQRELLGTGHAALQAVSNLNGEKYVMIINGDMPLVTGEELVNFYNEHKKSNVKMSIMSAIVPWESDFGRILRDDAGNIKEIKEFRDASEEEKKIKEVNLAIYLLDRDFFISALPDIRSENAQKEYYLTDLASLARKRKENIGSYICSDPEISMGVNCRSDLAKVEDIVKRRKLRRLMDSGVTIVDPSSTFIDDDVEIGMDTIIHPFTFIRGSAKIGENCSIGPSSDITDCLIGDFSKISYSIAVSSTIGAHAEIGPFSYIRPNNLLADKVKVGDFVELKKSVIGTGSKIPHLSYVGDAEIGEKVNIGAGTITCNYDGKTKHKTVIGSNTKIGSNTNLVAPVTVGENCVTGAGAVIIDNVPDDALAVGVPARIVEKKSDK